MARRTDRNHTPQTNNSIQNSVENEENGYPVPDINKTTINVIKELSNDHKIPSKKKHGQKSLRNSWRRY
jgi:hypothetical protein